MPLWHLCLSTQARDLPRCHTVEQSCDLYVPKRNITSSACTRKKQRVLSNSDGYPSISMDQDRPRHTKDLEGSRHKLQSRNNERERAAY